MSSTLGPTDRHLIIGFFWLLFISIIFLSVSLHIHLDKIEKKINNIQVVSEIKVE